MGGFFQTLRAKLVLPQNALENLGNLEITSGFPPFQVQNPRRRMDGINGT